MREAVKRALARIPRGERSGGTTILIYHRVGGGSLDELDTPRPAFEAQLDALGEYDVVSLDTALDRLDAGDRRPSVVLTFDDGFRDLSDNAWPLLRERGVPFTVYLATGYVGGIMHWEGSTARAAGAALTWEQLGEMVGSGLCTVGNHTHSHARPCELTSAEVDRCSDEIEMHLGAAARPRHFAFTWGVEVRSMRPMLHQRFRSAATGRLGRNMPGYDPMALRRVPVRRSDPVEFFVAKLSGSLLPERSYDLAVKVAKRLGARG
ncbi:MAG: polysaccharide deacetylase family protein [Acidimicrobiales bacterium]